jgi:hypothetical protein
MILITVALTSWEAWSRKQLPVKCKVKVSLFLIKHHAIKKYGGVEVKFHAFLASLLNGGDGQFHASTALPPGK